MMARACLSCLILVLALLPADPALGASGHTDLRLQLSTVGRMEFLPAVDLPRGVTTLDSLRLSDGGIIEYGAGSDMNRVDGFSPHTLQGLQNRGWLPSIRAYERYGFTSKRWSGAIEVRIHPGTRAVSAGGRWFDETAPWPLPVQAVTQEENFVAAMLLREDFSDYLRRRGSGAFAEWRPSPSRGVQIAWTEERQTSLDRARARLGLFGGKKNFRLNPPVEEGDWGVLRFRSLWAFGPGKESWERGSAHALLAEAQASGGELMGRREFVRLWVEQRGRQWLTPSQFFGYRLTGGWTPQGNEQEGSRLPAQWQFQAGGVGSLRGHRFQEFRGDRLALATLEYGLDLGFQLRPVVFVDGGKAWNQSQDLPGGIGGSGPMALDGGVGVQFGPEPVAARIDLARDLRAEHAAAKLTFRLGFPY